MRQEPTPPLVAHLEKLIWERDADQLQQAEPGCVQNLRASHQLDPASSAAALSDETLAVACQKRFFLEQAFEELFDRRARAWIADWLYHWGVRPEQAEDILQDLCLKFLSGGFASYDPRRSFRTYLSSCVRHAVQDSYRRKRPLAPLPEDGLTDASLFGPDQVAMADELQQRLDRVLLHLRDDRRQVLELVLAGEEPAAIAATLNVDLRKVYRLLFEARRQVEAMLGGLPDAGRSFPKN